MFRLTDSHNMTIAVDWDVKPQTKQTKQNNLKLLVTRSPDKGVLSKTMVIAV